MSTTAIEHVIQELDGEVIKLGALVERALVQALEALQANDEEKAHSVVVDDTTIDHLHLAIEEHSIVELTMQQPVGAREIRFLTSVQPITVDLERIGDEAEAIAHIVMRILPRRSSKQLQGMSSSQMNDGGSPFTEAILMQRIVDLGWQTHRMLQRTMKAYEERNSESARRIWDEDKGMDRHHYALRQDLLKMLEGSQAIVALAHDPCILQRVTYLTWIAHSLERMADHCTNICERIVFINEGQTDLNPSPELEGW